jgi:hypothetical protein
VWRERAGEAEKQIEGLRVEVDKARDGSKASSEQLQVALDTAHSRCVYRCTLSIHGCALSIHGCTLSIHGCTLSIHG